jgi:hypothetical protein
MALGYVVRKRAGHRILQQHLIRFQPVAVNHLNLGGIEIHGYHADEKQEAQHDPKNRNARGNKVLSDKWSQCARGGGAKVANPSKV